MSTSTYKAHTLAQSCRSRKKDNLTNQTKSRETIDGIRNLEQLTAYSSGVSSSEGGARKFNNSRETSKQELHNSNTKFDVRYSLFAKISLSFYVRMTMVVAFEPVAFLGTVIKLTMCFGISCFLNFSTKNNVNYFFFFFLLRLFLSFSIAIQI